MEAIGGGVFISSTFASQFGKIISDNLYKLDNSMQTLIGFIVLLAVTWGGIILIGNIFSKLVKLSGLGIFDRLLGFIFGAGKIFVIFAIITYAISNIEFISKKLEAKTNNSFLYPILIKAGGYIIKLDPKILQKKKDNTNLNLQDLKSKVDETTKKLKEDMK